MAAPSRRGIVSLFVGKRLLLAEKWRATKVCRNVRYLCTKDDSNHPQKPPAGAETDFRDKRTLPEQIRILEKLEKDRDLILQKSQEDESKHEQPDDSTVTSAPKRVTRTFSHTPVQPKKRTQAILYRTNETDPAKHTEAHEGLFYSIPKLDMDKWLHSVFHAEYYPTTKAFQDNYVMVRKPALEVMKYLNMADYDMPAIRYILYGHGGAGKTHTMGHVLHYCALQDWMIVHVRWPGMWGKYAKECLPSSFKENRFDTPNEGVTFLACFKYMNEDIIKTADLRTLNTYEWSKRESTEAGAPWEEIIELGLERPGLSCDIVGVLLKEIKVYANQGKIKVLVAIDGVNGLFGNSRHERPVDRTIIRCDELSLSHNFKKMIRNDWKNAACLLAVDKNASDLPPKEMKNVKSYLPTYLLELVGGFELLDPHIPIHVPEYSDKEANAALDYYADNQWIQNPKGLTKEGRKEMLFLSERNPMELYKTTRAW